MDSASEQLTLGTISLRLLGVFVLVLANAFFVAAEFALVSVRRSRIDALAATGDRTARVIQQTLDRLNYYISAAQLGITMASLGLGWIGESAMASLIDRAFIAIGLTVPSPVAHSIAAIIVGYVVLTFLHVVIGEQAPKSFAIVSPERVSRWVVRPMRWFAGATAPFTWLLNNSSNALLRLFGLATIDETERVHSPEELRLLVRQSDLEETPSQMIAGIFDFHNKKARDVMRPRTEIVAIPIDARREDLWEIIRREGYSRFPVYGESLDDVVGVFLAKDLWLNAGDEPFTLQRLVREALYVPDTRPAERVLDDLRKTRAHMAIVLDEYGGTAGILTMEDLVEEFVGDIADEYDIASREALETDGVLELAGSLSLIDVRSDHNVPIPEGSWSTLGGFVFSRLGRVPKIGDRATFPGGELEVAGMDGRRVAVVRVHRAPAAGRASA